MKHILVTTLALVCLSAFTAASDEKAKAQEKPITKAQAAELAELSEGHVKELSAEARRASMRIGKLAMSGKLPNDKVALDEMKYLVELLDEINGRLETLEYSIAEIKAWKEGKEVSEAKVAKAVGDIEKLKISNYFQFQYRDTDQAGKQQHAFELRRARLGTTYTVDDNSTVKASFDIVTGAKDTAAEMKDLIYTFRPTGSDTKFVAGQFSNPVGYEVSRSSSRREFPERSTYNRKIWAGERIRGVMIDHAFENGSVYGGVANSLSVGDKEHISPTTGARTAAFGGVRFGEDDAKFGVGFWAGDRPAFVGTSATSPEVSRQFFYADAQFENVLTDGLFFRGEVMVGKDRIASSSGGAGLMANDMNGYHGLLGYDLTETTSVFTRYSVFDPNDDIDGDGVMEYGIGLRHFISKAASLTLAYEVFEDPSVANSPYGVMTLRTQFKF